MKEGTGGDPFADDPVDASDTEDTGETDDSSAPDETPNGSGAAATTTGTSSETATKSDDASSSLPYIYRRDRVKEDRDQVPFFLRDHVRDLEDEFIDELEDRLDTNVYKADAREAALEIAFETRIEETADLLREWGYDH